MKYLRQWKIVSVVNKFHKSIDEIEDKLKEANYLEQMIS